MTDTDTHILAVGDMAIARYVDYRENEDNPWFAATVTNLNYDDNTIDVVFEDGDESNGLELEEVRYAPNGRPNTIGSDSMRCNSVFDLLAVAPNLQLAAAVLRVSLPAESRAEPRTLVLDDLVIAKYAGFRGKDDNPWCVYFIV